MTVDCNSMIITDDHMHLYNYLKLKALEQFKNAGGTHVFLVSLLSKHYNVKPTKGEDFKKIFDAHISLVNKANKIVRAFAVLAVHPAEITIIGGRLGYRRAAEIMKEALELAGKYVEDGKAVAIKSGRPHYKVPKEVWDLSNEVMMHAFEVAKDVGYKFLFSCEIGTNDLKNHPFVYRRIEVTGDMSINEFSRLLNPPQILSYKIMQSLKFFLHYLIGSNNYKKLASTL